MSNELNKYLHGTVWVYPGSEKKRGVKRLALILSSSQANTDASTVNVVAIVSGAADSSRCVPLSIGQNYQICCDQIHTVPKTELTEYVGALPPGLLSSVKAKICTHLSLDDEVDSRAALRKAVSTMAETLTKLVGEDDAAAEKTKQPKSAKKSAKPESAAEPAPTDTPPETKKPARGRGVRRKTAAPEKISKKSGKPIRKVRKYTDEEKAFIADKANSTDDVMKRFGLTSKNQAHALRNYIRNRQGKPSTPETPETPQ